MRRKTLLPLIAAISLATVQAGIAQADDSVKTNDYWWPERLSLEPLRDNAAESSPLGGDFDYAQAFAELDLQVVKAEITQLMTTSQDWWPADYGNYGPFFIRMAWHSAGTYRTIDGRGGSDGGMQRFAPLNSWPDNANLDKARRLLWPVKQKYGRALSWGDLMVLAGTVAMESMGFKTFGFAGGREDDWQPEIVNWGTENEWLTSNRMDNKGELKRPFGATEMGLIYVNPEGPHGNPDPLAAAKAIREAFGRMAMNDEETAALIAGGHTFGKAHGAHNAKKCVGVAPEAEGLEAQGLGWKSSCGSGKGADTITSGLEGAWTINPVAWTHNYLQNLYGFEWEKTKSPSGATQWKPVGDAGTGLVPDAYDPNTRHQPMMFTTDLALREDPAYRAITSRWLEHPEEFELAFAKAWFKLTHRDLGPRSRYLGSMVPQEALIWQDPVPAADYKLVSISDIKKLKKAISDSGLSDAELIKTAWSAAVTFRGTDMRGGVNGARLRLAPQKDWAVNEPEQLAKVLAKLEAVQKAFNDKSGKKQVSLADVIVLGGAVAVENAAAKAGHKVAVPFVPGRTDATQAQTDEVAFAALEPTADAFRNYFVDAKGLSPTEALIDQADLLTLTVPEMSVLLAGMRSLNVNYGQSANGVFTQTPGALSNDFFVNLLDLNTEWHKTDDAGIYEGKAYATGKVLWQATPVDLIFGSNSELRAVAEFYAADDAKQQFVDDFVKAWVKVMQLDRFDLKS
ncbi:catalase/peroxidase HPI [Halioxenophilus sp. WMMB6]|uniref:catalase/peroxidase HPI n=1 Tax=Halioxenophilus sp. WMMB6 TaxID=3073815 RepID=UPI00295E5A63|nr:catalase/peroxidase HPI [Halioxenophilus sp. WMMB6]